MWFFFQEEVAGISPDLWNKQNGISMWVIFTEHAACWETEHRDWGRGSEWLEMCLKGFTFGLPFFSSVSVRTWKHLAGRGGPTSPRLPFSGQLCRRRHLALVWLSDRGEVGSREGVRGDWYLRSSTAGTIQYLNLLSFNTLSILAGQMLVWFGAQRVPQYKDWVIVKNIIKLLKAAPLPPTDMLFHDIFKLFTGNLVFPYFSKGKERKCVSVSGKGAGSMSLYCPPSCPTCFCSHTGTWHLTRHPWPLCLWRLFAIFENHLINTTTV